MSGESRILVVDENRDSLVERFPTGPFATETCSGTSLPETFGQYDCLVCTDTPGGAAPQDVISTVRTAGWTLPVVVAARNGDESLATAVLGAGADDYVALGADDDLTERVRAATDEPTPIADGSTDVGTAVTDAGTPVPLEAIAGSLSEVLVTIDEESTIEYVNPAVEEVFGYDRETVLGSSLTMLMPDRFQTAHHEGVARYLSTGERALDWSSVEIPGQHADGHEIDIEISFVEFTAGSDHYFTGLIRDVSQLVERETALSDLYDASRELLAATTPTEIAEIAVGTASEALDLPVSGLFRYDEDADALVPVALSERARELFGEPVFSRGEALAWQTFQAGETRVYDAVDENEGRHNPETPIRTELHVPVGEEHLLVSGSTDDVEFDDYQIDFAESLAAHTAVASQRAERDAELRRYETVFETIEDRVCVLDEEGRLEMVNDALCSFLGRGEDELLGSYSGQFVDETDAASLRSELDRLEYGETMTIEVGVRTGERTVPCEIDFTPLPKGAHMEGVVAAVHDISDRKRVESALEQQRTRFEELFDNIPDPAVEVRFDDATPVVQSVNPAFEETFGYAEAAVVGRSLNEFVLPERDEAAATQMDRRAAGGELVETEVRRETDAGIRYFLFRGIPVESDDSDGTLAFGIYTDITDQRLRERRLAVLNRVLRHNIRNDMTVVRGRAEHLVETEVDEAVTRSADRIRGKAQEVIDLAEGIRAAEQALEREDVPQRPIDAVVREAVDPYRERASTAVTVDGAEGPSPNIDERVGILVEELVENAIEHGDEEATAVAVDLEADRSGVSVTVSDDGPGIPDNERAVVEHGEETPLEHGEGVGLWLVHWLTTTLGGEVGFAENDPRGSRITLSFPASSVESGGE